MATFNSRGGFAAIPGMTSEQMVKNGYKPWIMGSASYQPAGGAAQTADGASASGINQGGNVPQGGYVGYQPVGLGGAGSSWADQGQQAPGGAQSATATAGTVPASGDAAEWKQVQPGDTSWYKKPGKYINSKGYRIEIRAGGPEVANEFDTGKYWAVSRGSSGGLWTLHHKDEPKQSGASGAAASGSATTTTPETPETQGGVDLNASTPLQPGLRVGQMTRGLWQQLGQPIGYQPAGGAAQTAAGQAGPGVNQGGAGDVPSATSSPWSPRNMNIPRYDPKTGTWTGWL